MKHQITSFDAARGYITVLFSTDDDKEIGEYAIDLPVVNGAFPSVESIENLINVYKPTYQYERETSLATGLDGSHIAALVVPRPVVAKTLSELSAAVRAERDMLLAQSDWTQLPDVSEDIRNAWAPYRQLLRDITTQALFPSEVVWPVKPA